MFWIHWRLKHLLLFFLWGTDHWLCLLANSDYCLLICDLSFSLTKRQEGVWHQINVCHYELRTSHYLLFLLWGTGKDWLFARMCSLFFSLQTSRGSMASRDVGVYMTRSPTCIVHDSKWFRTRRLKNKNVIFLESCKQFISRQSVPRNYCRKIFK